MPCTGDPGHEKEPELPKTKFVPLRNLAVRLG